MPAGIRLPPLRYLMTGTIADSCLPLASPKARPPSRFFRPFSFRSDTFVPPVFCSPRRLPKSPFRDSVTRSPMPLPSRQSALNKSVVRTSSQVRSFDQSSAIPPPLTGPTPFVSDFLFYPPLLGGPQCCANSALEATLNLVPIAFFQLVVHFFLVPIQICFFIQMQRRTPYSFPRLFAPFCVLIFFPVVFL